MKILLLILVVVSSSVVKAQLSNPVMFIGQKVLGSVVEAPLTVDSNFQLISGYPGVTNISSATTITTTSTTPVLMTGMTLTPKAGTYQLSGSTNVQSNSNNADIGLQLYVGGTIVASSIVSGTPQIQSGLSAAFNMKVPISTQAEVTVNGAQAIELRWSTTGGTATAVGRNLQINRVR